MSEYCGLVLLIVTELTVSRAEGTQTVEVCTEVLHRLVYGSEYICGSI